MPYHSKFHSFRAFSRLQNIPGRIPFIDRISYLCDMKLKQLLPLLLWVITLVSSSCRKDELLTDSSAKLEFSTDSVLFDTVFHFAGSTTKVFRIYNRHDRTMNISRAYLAGGTGSAFKLNIDGEATTPSDPIINDI